MTERYFRVEEQVPMMYVNSRGNTKRYTRYECRLYCIDNLPETFTTMSDDDKTETLWENGEVIKFYDEWPKRYDLDLKFDHYFDESRKARVVSITEITFTFADGTVGYAY